jgi:hypothetical protein
MTLSLRALSIAFASAASPHAWNLAHVAKRVQDQIHDSNIDTHLAEMSARTVQPPPFAGKAKGCAPIDLPQSLSKVAYLADAYILPTVKGGESQVVLAIVYSGLNDRTGQGQDMTTEEDDAYQKIEKQRLDSIHVTCGDSSLPVTSSAVAKRHPMFLSSNSFNGKPSSLSNTQTDPGIDPCTSASRLLDWVCTIPSKHRLTDSWYDLQLRVQVSANVTNSAG